MMHFTTHSLTVIFSYLDIPSIGRLKRVCKDLYKIVDSLPDTLWFPWCVTYVPNYICDYTIENGASWKYVLFNYLTQYPLRKHAEGYRIIITGDPGVGKRTLLSRFRTESPNEYVFTAKSVFGNYKLSCFRQPEAPTDEFYIGAQGAILMFDVTSRLTYKNIPIHHRDIVRVCENIPIAVVGNKVDVRDRKVRPRHITFHRKKNLIYYDMSAKSHYNIVKPFEYLVSKLFGSKLDIDIATQVPPEVEIPSDLIESYERDLRNAATIPLPDDDDDEDFDIAPIKSAEAIVRQALSQNKNVRANKEVKLLSTLPIPRIVDAAKLIDTKLEFKMAIPPTFADNKINFLVFPQTTLADRIQDMYFNKKLFLETLPTVNGVWNVAFMRKCGDGIEMNINNFTHLYHNAVPSLGKVVNKGSIYFGFLEPGAKTVQYKTKNNTRLKCIYPISVPKNCCGISANLREIVFTDSKYVSVDETTSVQMWNKSESDVFIYLAIDIWNTGLAPAEIEALERLVF